MAAERIGDKPDPLGAGIGQLGVDGFQVVGFFVQAVNPRKQFELVSNPGVAPIAEEVAQKLERVLEKL